MLFIRQGAMGAIVVFLQQLLSAKADGVFGNQTRVAVRQHQRLNDLVNDGIVGPKTWESITGFANVDSLVGVVPSFVMTEFVNVAKEYEINTNLRVAHFLAQCAHESINFSAKVENLNYSETALKRVFSKYFPGDLAKEYARQPSKIANRVYANRMKNGNEESGDGWKFRGRGFIQLTGKANYMEFNKTVPEDLLEMPYLVETKYPLTSAGWFWNSRNLNSIADTGSTEDVVKKITLKVNGGYNGLADRQYKFVTYYSSLVPCSLPLTQHHN